MSTMRERARVIWTRLWNGLERLENKPMYWPFTTLAPLWAWLRSLLAPSPDQLEATGGVIDAGEMASLLVQRMIRRWLFLGIITAITTYIWAVWDPIWRHSPADTWNFFLSWLAIFIEGVVGKFFFAQSVRDAKVIRAILRELVDHILALIEQIASVTQHIVSMLKQNVRMERTMIARLDAQDRKLDAIYTLLAARAKATEATEHKE